MTGSNRRRVALQVPHPVIPVEESCVKVEIWSDVVCPWCLIGKRRFEAALEQFAHRDAVQVVWRSFELDPSAPADLGVPLVLHLAGKYGVEEAEAAAMIERMRQTGAAEGADLRFDRARSGNTFDSHRVLHLAAQRGVQDAVKERFLLAYLEEGELISDHDTLVRLAAEAGLDAGAVAAVLAGDAYAAEVRSDEADARSLGATGVPFFVIDRAYGVAGAQPADVLLGVLEQAWAAANPLTMVGAAGQDGACTDGSCTIQDPPADVAQAPRG
jgi:predicted DsbA family dithiol-disulfide isomerase